MLCFIALGAYVSHRPPGWLDRWGLGLAGHGLGFATVAYRSGLLPAYVVLGLLAIALALRRPRLRGPVAFAVVAFVSTWLLSDLFKSLFGRLRPEGWSMVHETSASYASGHAALTLVTYGLLAFFLWRSSLPRPVRLAASSALAAWCAIVAWSRLAMGAHYATDLIGGWLLAVAVLAGLRALVELFRDVRLSVRPTAAPPT